MSPSSSASTSSMRSAQRRCVRTCRISIRSSPSAWRRCFAPEVSTGWPIEAGSPRPAGPALRARPTDRGTRLTGRRRADVGGSRAPRQDDGHISPARRSRVDHAALRRVRADGRRALRGAGERPANGTAAPSIGSSRDSSCRAAVPPPTSTPAPPTSRATSSPSLSHVRGTIGISTRGAGHRRRPDLHQPRGQRAARLRLHGHRARSPATRP